MHNAIPDDSKSPPLAQGLQRPDAYPHAVRTIEMRETHISWVFLTGEYAYKVKKPVRFDFLDFSTLDRREHFCREELRINRRYAEELYLDVVPICGSLDRPKVAGEGVPLEYAVKMVQFPEEALLSRMLSAGKLDSAHIDALAASVARFHAAASSSGSSPSAEVRTCGNADSIRQDAEGNLTALRATLPAEMQGALEPLATWTEQAAKQLAPTFEQRQTEGFVRECHGDLHLSNIIFWRGRVIPFDGIEFNDEFRWIDVLSDVAFVAMDLEDRGRADFAHRLANAYFETTGDYSGLAVWRWYLVYRALVRAKVAALRACQAGNESEAQARFREAESYVRQAQAAIQSPRPTLTITYGVSGSGKTYGTQTLVEQQGAFRIRSDVERKRLFDLPALERTASAIGQGIYTADASAQTYERLLSSARQVIASGHDAVVDATFLKRAQRTRFQRLAETMGARFVILPFTADRTTLERRILGRLGAGRDASEADLSVLEHQLAALEPLDDDELRDCTSADSGA